MKVVLKMTHIHIKSNKKDRQALLKAKYCPRVAAVSSTQKEKKTKKNEKTDVALTSDFEIQ